MNRGSFPFQVLKLLLSVVQLRSIAFCSAARNLVDEESLGASHLTSFRSMPVSAVYRQLGLSVFIQTRAPDGGFVNRCCPVGVPARPGR